MFNQTDDAKARQAFRLPDFFKLNPAEADQVRSEGERLFDLASAAAKIMEYPVSEVIFHRRMAAGFWFKHYGIQVRDEVVDFTFVEENGAIVGVGVDRRRVSLIPAMQGASVHQVGFTVFSPPAVEGIAQHLVTRFGNYHMIYWNCVTFGRILLDLIVPGWTHATSLLHSLPLDTLFIAPATFARLIARASFNDTLDALRDSISTQRNEKTAKFLSDRIIILHSSIGALSATGIEAQKSTQRNAMRGNLELSRFARIVNADTVAGTIVAVGLVGGITFGVLLAKLIIVWYASDEEDDGPNAEREEMKRQLSEWPGFEDEQLIWKMVCDAKPSDEQGDGPSTEPEKMKRQLSEWPTFNDEQSMVYDANASDEEGDGPSAECEEMERQLSEMFYQEVMDLDKGTPLRDGTSVVTQNRGRGTARAIKWESEVVQASWGDGRHEGYNLKDSEQDNEAKGAKGAKEAGRGDRKFGKHNALSRLSVTKPNPTLGQ